MINFDAADGISVVLRGGAMRGVSLAGALHYLEQKQILVKDLTGASIGSLVATAASNDLSALKIKKLFLENPFEETQIAQSHKPPGLKLPVPGILEPVRRLAGAQGVLRAIAPPVFTPRRLLAPALADLQPALEQFVRKGGFVPNDKLRIVTSTISGRALVFEGRDYPKNYKLHEAITASCAVPFLYRPALFGSQLLFDGEFVHPRALTPGPAIVFKLIENKMVNKILPDRPCDFVASVGDQKQAFFGKISENTAERLFWKGYHSAYKALEEPIENGLIPRA